MDSFFRIHIIYDGPMKQTFDHRNALFFVAAYFLIPIPFPILNH
jgi:hypothetical protein